jgi:hypothetical protein
MKVIGRIVGGVLGSAIGRQKGNHPVAGAVIGAGTLFVARRMFPQRYAVLAATTAAAYITKKWADRAEERRAAEEAQIAAAKLAEQGGVDSYAGTGTADGGAIPPPAIPSPPPPATPASAR